MKTIRVLFICAGNICRSPTAEGVFRSLAAEAGLAEHLVIDSAGTHGYHVGEPPDPRARRAAAQRGYSLDGQRARQVTAQDCERFDLLLVMDEDNLRAVRRLCPPAHTHKLKKLVDYLPQSGYREIPDPYYGGPEGFELVLNLIEEASRALLDELRRRLTP
ncbi:MAG: low molecular weight phosphotyrosine protein phosphatase [Truepera sp.]|nr:low molecular weight phosphotyrosine protein phosphatase [Truepera sp.]